MHSNRYLLENVQIDKSNIITAGLLSNSFALLFNFLVYFVISLFFKVDYTLNVLYVPLILINILILIYGVSYILSIIYIYLRDFDHFWEIFLIAAFWANPIVYSESVLLEYKIVLWLNPVAGIIMNLHNVLLYGQAPNFQLLAWNFAYAFIVVIIGYFVFKHYSKKVVEVL